MITMIVHLSIPAENVAAFEELMTHVCEMVRRHEPGVPYYAFARSADDPGTYVIIEVYRDAEVHAAHMASAWITESLPKAARLASGKPKITQYVSPGCEPVALRFA